uniref:Uncharacterized protein n=1 Tax=Caenorhabditis japonica TaxID=281687 RepID=A0A8R1DS18_CAEJA
MRLRKRNSLLLPLLVTFSAISIAARRTDPCLDGEFENDVESLRLPSQYANLTPPWRLTDGKYAKVIRSEGLNYQWSWVKALRVKGFLKSLYNACIEKFGASGCALYPIDDGGWGAYRLEIGDTSSNKSTYGVSAEPIVLYEWRSVLGAPRSQWRFTVDTLAMFDDGAGDLFMIDPTETGYKHVCDKKLVPTFEDWTQWSENQDMKIMGFYDLRSSGFASQNETFQTFVNDKIKKADKRISQRFYCENVLKGVANLEGNTPVCHTTYPEKEVARDISQKRKVMINEMGISWNSSIGKAAEDLEAVFCTARQFVDIRSRLLHKVPSSADSRPTGEEPRVIEDGRPMVNDSAQIHARPILDMAENAPELPPEYPSVPRAEPNSQLEFVEPPLVDGAGSSGSAPVAYHDDSSEVFDEDDVKTERHEGGTADIPETDMPLHNSIGDDLPVMRFDKVEESGGLADAAASVMKIPAASSLSEGVSATTTTTSLWLLIINALLYLIIFL